MYCFTISTFGTCDTLLFCVQHILVQCFQRDCSARCLKWHLIHLLLHSALSPPADRFIALKAPRSNASYFFYFSLVAQLWHDSANKTKWALLWFELSTLGNGWVIRVLISHFSCRLSFCFPKPIPKLSTRYPLMLPTIYMENFLNVLPNPGLEQNI